ncbi:hypothetical protein SteCoe_10736 [Stentor coeruleus]|uniref:Uncharacterized protein n=1 Tax=Stentor coeruleus TaxID=5963 RepID=A0A1R2CEU9_9CILI|nr:hypothetical protein SteCoe_10736 [Stentor coeruleus]
MNNRKLAIQELCEGFTVKYRADAASKKLIHSEVQKYLQNKDKITVEDLDKLEEDIKRLCGCTKSSSTRGKVSISSIDKYPIISETLTSSLDPEQSPLVSNYPQAATSLSPNKASGKKIVGKYPDHTIFPAEGIFSHKHSWTDSRDYLPGKSKLSDYDDWGKIVKADHLKFLNEEKLNKIKYRNQQAYYRRVLLDQIDLKKKLKNDEVVQGISRFDSFQNSPKKNSEEKKHLDEIVRKKKEDTEKKHQNKLEEQKAMRLRWAELEEIEIKRMIEKRKVQCELAKEQLIQAKARTHSKYIINELEKQHSNSLIEDSIKKIDDAEKLKIEVVHKRIQYVHDEDRLKKLLPRNTPHRRATSEMPEAQSPSFENPSSPRIKNEAYLQALKKQIEDKRLRDSEYKKQQKEQGLLWKEQDQKAKHDDFVKKLKKLHIQKTLRDEYFDNIQAKQKKKYEDYQLSPSEVGINKKIYENSLAILDNGLTLSN